MKFGGGPWAGLSSFYIRSSEAQGIRSPEEVFYPSPANGLGVRLRHLEGYEGRV